jgi:hypothetical protein
MKIVSNIYVISYYPLLGTGECGTSLFCVPSLQCSFYLHDCTWMTAFLGVTNELVVLMLGSRNARISAAVEAREKERIREEKRAIDERNAEREAKKKRQEEEKAERDRITRERTARELEDLKKRMAERDREKAEAERRRSEEEDKRIEEEERQKKIKIEEFKKLKAANDQRTQEREKKKEEKEAQKAAVMDGVRREEAERIAAFQSAMAAKRAMEADAKAELRQQQRELMEKKAKQRDIQVKKEMKEAKQKKLSLAAASNARRGAEELPKADPKWNTAQGGATTATVSESPKVSSSITNKEVLLGDRALVSALKKKKGVTELVAQVVKANATTADERRAYVNVRDQNGSTSIFHGVWPGHAAAIELLLSYGADVNWQNNRKNTALHLACDRMHLPIMELLIKSGARVDLENLDGLVCWQMAKKADQEDMKQFVMNCVDALPPDQQVLALGSMALTMVTGNGHDSLVTPSDGNTSASVSVPGSPAITSMRSIGDNGTPLLSSARRSLMLTSGTPSRSTNVSRRNSLDRNLSFASLTLPPPVVSSMSPSTSSTPPSADTSFVLPTKSDGSALSSEEEASLRAAWARERIEAAEKKLRAMKRESVKLEEKLAEARQNGTIIMLPLTPDPTNAPSTPGLRVELTTAASGVATPMGSSSTTTISPGMAALQRSVGALQAANAFATAVSTNIGEDVEARLTYDRAEAERKRQDDETDVRQGRAAGTSALERERFEKDEFEAKANDVRAQQQAGFILPTPSDGVGTSLHSLSFPPPPPPLFLPL